MSALSGYWASATAFRPTLTPEVSSILLWQAKPAWTVAVPQRTVPLLRLPHHGQINIHLVAS